MTQTHRRNVTTEMLLSRVDVEKGGEWVFGRARCTHCQQMHDIIMPHLPSKSACLFAQAYAEMFGAAPERGGGGGQGGPAPSPPGGGAPAAPTPAPREGGPTASLATAAALEPAAAPETLLDSDRKLLVRVQRAGDYTERLGILRRTTRGIVRDEFGLDAAEHDCLRGSIRVGSHVTIHPARGVVGVAVSTNATCPPFKGDVVWFSDTGDDEREFLQLPDRVGTEAIYRAYSLAVGTKFPPNLDVVRDGSKAGHAVIRIVQPTEGVVVNDGRSGNVRVNVPAIGGLPWRPLMVAVRASGDPPEWASFDPSLQSAVDYVLQHADDYDLIHELLTIWSNPEASSAAKLADVLRAFLLTDSLQSDCEDVFAAIAALKATLSVAPQQAAPAAETPVIATGGAAGPTVQPSGQAADLGDHPCMQNAFGQHQ